MSKVIEFSKASKKEYEATITLDRTVLNNAIKYLELQAQILNISHDLISKVIKTAGFELDRFEIDEATLYQFMSTNMQDVMAEKDALVVAYFAEYPEANYHAYTKVEFEHGEINVGTGLSKYEDNKWYRYDGEGWVYDKDFM